LSADLQLLRSFQMSASLAHKFCDSKLLLGELGTVEGKKASDAIHHLIRLAEANKDPTQGSFCAWRSLLQPARYRAQVHRHLWPLFGWV